MGLKSHFQLFSVFILTFFLRYLRNTNTNSIYCMSFCSNIVFSFSFSFIRRKITENDVYRGIFSKIRIISIPDNFFKIIPLTLFTCTVITLEYCKSESFWIYDMSVFSERNLFPWIYIRHVVNPEKNYFFDFFPWNNGIYIHLKNCIHNPEVWEHFWILFTIKINELRHVDFNTDMS